MGYSDLTATAYCFPLNHAESFTVLEAPVIATNLVDLNHLKHPASEHRKSQFPFSTSQVQTLKIFAPPYLRSQRVVATDHRKSITH